MCALSAAPRAHKFVYDLSPGVPLRSTPGFMLPSATRTDRLQRPPILIATTHAVHAANLVSLALPTVEQPCSHYPRPNRSCRRRETMQTLVTTKTLACGLWVVLLLAAFASIVVGQSTDVAWPSPVRTNEVRGTIPARDLGDPRVTDHFYAITGTPGDLLITVDSRNFNGDVDVFTGASTSTRRH